jgi:hypothetical protein
MNVGAEPKKIAILAVLAAVAGIVFYSNSSDTPGPETKKPPSRLSITGGADAPPPIPTPPNVARPKPSVRNASREFRPTLKFRPEERPNFDTIDPSLHLELLAKVQSVELEGGTRSLFQFSTAPPPPAAAQATTVAAIHPKGRMYGPEPPPKPVAPPPPPPPPPITLKFYGYSTPRADGHKRAFFLDGEDIFVAAEGEVIKKRYRVVRIDVNSVIMEDTEHKNNRQTLILQQEQAG